MSTSSCFYVCLFNQHSQSTIHLTPSSNDLLNNVHPPIDPCIFKTRIVLLKSDINELKCDAIVNAANEGLRGCFVPGHCIDAAIHSKAGPELLAHTKIHFAGCGTGEAVLTPAFQHPNCTSIIHTVAPRNGFEVTLPDGTKVRTVPHAQGLMNCYQRCLELCDAHHLRSIAFCCIGTGIFDYPKPEACKVSLSTVYNYLKEHPTTSLEKIIFCTHTSDNMNLYQTWIQSWFPTVVPCIPITILLNIHPFIYTITLEDWDVKSTTIASIVENIRTQRPLIPSCMRIHVDKCGDTSLNQTLEISSSHFHVAFVTLLELAHYKFPEDCWTLPSSLIRMEFY
ncbi:MAG: protein-ADP-ribose hydrolase [Sylvanvirus sp.]|uniref:Protein-ADP-ribose hydrolase n=1 Tax=Sylvanvirus sp. TaxID=2487774 RepID=A0A3G5AI47_9VIRU|nr:MAG: protein-ADP-ribose hydrolase [Sylvanvirus sp.]